MKKIKAYKCEFCKKIYENSSSCKSHENKCYFNPRTKSCAACTFLLRTAIEVATGSHFEYNACLLNHEIMRNLKTKCPDFADRDDMISVVKSEEEKHEVFDKEKATLNAFEYYKDIKKVK